MLENELCLGLDETPDVLTEKESQHVSYVRRNVCMDSSLPVVKLGQRMVDVYLFFLILQAYNQPVFPSFPHPGGCGWGTECWFISSGNAVPLKDLKLSPHFWLILMVMTMEPWKSHITGRRNKA